MKLAVQFPSILYRNGVAAIRSFAIGVEQLGYDQLDMFDHVTMALPMPGRASARPVPNTPRMEALTMLAYFASVTERIGLGTEVLVLPQRQPAVVAKQVATVDILSGGRVRLGVGVGWQEPEYDSLGVPFRERGRRMDECIRLLRAYWSEPSVTFDGRYYRAAAMAMEPKPRSDRSGPPIWIGGGSEAALRRAGQLGDGWLAEGVESVDAARGKMATIRRHAEAAGRDPSALGFQFRLGDLGDLESLARRAVSFAGAGFNWGTAAISGVYGDGQVDVDAELEMLGHVRDRVVRELG